MADQTVMNPRIRTRRSQVLTGAMAKVTATVIKKEDTDCATGDYLKAMRAYEVKQLDDPFINLYTVSGGSMALIAPDFPPQQMIKLPNESSSLRQCIDAMVTNIDSFGYRLEFIGEKGEEDSPASIAEKSRLENLLEQPNGEYTVTELRERVRRDIETMGYGFMEVGRDRNGEIAMINHVPAHTMRMTAKQADLVPVTIYLKRDGRLLKVNTHRRFRRYVQQVGARLVYFKEFGDPRVIDPGNGVENKDLGFDEQATEIFQLSLYSPGSPYGTPRWVNTLPAIMGTRESELTNLQFFKDNAIPAMAILVSGGALTSDTLANIEAHFTGSRGRGSMNRVVVLEATGDDAMAKVDGQVPVPKLELKPLVSDRQTDGLFAEYEEANEKKIRAAFRLPPLFVGRSDDYSHATADASMVMADAQVFGPERNKEDDLWNSNLLTSNGMPLQYWRMRSNPPRLVSADSILAALNTMDDLGAMSPNIAIGIANELFDLAITPIEHEWGNYPFPLVMQLCIGNNLKGIEDMEKIADLLAQQTSNENAAAKALTGKNLPNPKGNLPKDPTGKPKAKAPAPGPAEGGSKQKSVSKSDARELIAFTFRQVAARGNDISQPLMYKARKRSRLPLPPKRVA